jgi:chemotaxis signal transduction protein
MTASEPAPTEALPEDAAPTRWVCFELGGDRYGIEILRAVEVLPETEIEPVPGAAPCVLGVCNLRGRIITVVDPSLNLGLDTGTSPGPGGLIVVDWAGEPIGLRVDGVTGVYPVREPQIIRIPGDRCLSAVFAEVSGSSPPLRLLDIDRLLAPLAPSGPSAA